MKILHTSDWHLGRSFHGFGMLDAQLGVLEALVDVVRSERVDVVVIAGDIYDRAVPSAEVVQGLSELLCALQGAGAAVVGISGNHDSAERIGFAEGVMSRAGVSLRGDITTTHRPVIIPQRDGGGDVAFYPIPYIEVDRARHALGMPETRSHDRLLAAALDRSRADLANRRNVRAVAVVHAFVTGGQSCDSELALSVGGSAEIPLRSLAGFDYVALGHLHGRQTLGNGRARYSGSPLAYSFSERSHVKGAWLIDLPSEGEVTVEQVELPVFRRLHQVHGTLDELLTDSRFADAESSFVQAVLTDHTLPVHAMARLRRRFPHAVLLGHEPPAVDVLQESYVVRTRGRDDLTLACDFVTQTIGRDPTTDEISDLTGVIYADSSAVDDSRGDLAVA